MNDVKHNGNRDNGFRCTVSFGFYIFLGNFSQSGKVGVVLSFRFQDSDFVLLCNNLFHTQVFSLALAQRLKKQKVL
jgi:hypothetical protein